MSVDGGDCTNGYWTDPLARHGIIHLMQWLKMPYDAQQHTNRGLVAFLLPVPSLVNISSALPAL